MCACAWCAHISSCDLFNASPQIFKKTQYTKTPQVRIHIVDCFFLKKLRDEEKSMLETMLKTNT